MRLLLIDNAGLMLDFALRCQEAGHTVKWFVRKARMTMNIGKGLLTGQSEQVSDWREWARWADLIMLPDNVRYLQDLEPYRRMGIPIVAATPETAAWETDRQLGQNLMKKRGLAVPDCKEFKRYDEAIAYVKREGRAFVCKPCGDEEDKSLSYVSKSPADLVFMLERWKKQQRHKGSFILQERVSGCEMAVGGWFGPGGFSTGWLENWEFKKLMAGETGPACFTPDAEVLTKTGWKLWPEVTMDDEICTLVEGEITYEKPSQMVAKPFEGDLVGWSNRYADILVTPGHNMYVQDDHYRKPFWFESAVVAAEKTRTFLRGGGRWVGADTGVTPEKAALLGIHIADGYCRDRSLVFGNCPAHKQGPFKAIANAAGYPAKMYGSDLYINSTALVEEFKPLGLSHEKRVPQSVKDAAPEVIASFLRGYGAGDGSTRATNQTYTTVSKGLADDLQELALKVGWAAGINTLDRRGESHQVKGYECVNRRVSYSVGVSQQKLKSELRPDFCERVPYSGMVYCCTVSSHVIYTRRNGKPCWIGQTGEMGTVCRTVAKSKLADKVLAPFEEDLHKADYVGYVDVNCIIDEDGTPWPLEFTMRPGWPTFNIQMAMLAEGKDPAEWLLNLSEGKDAKPFSPECLAVGVVMVMPDFPYSQNTRTDAMGIPIYGLNSRNRANVHPCELQQGKAPHDLNGKVVELPCLTSAGDYLLVASGLGNSVREARAKAYRVLEGLSVPNSPFWRPDIGQRLKKQLPMIQSLGYATGLQF